MLWPELARQKGTMGLWQYGICETTDGNGSLRTYPEHQIVGINPDKATCTPVAVRMRAKPSHHPA